MLSLFLYVYFHVHGLRLLQIDIRSSFDNE